MEIPLFTFTENPERPVPKPERGLLEVVNLGLERMYRITSAADVRYPHRLTDEQRAALIAQNVMGPGLAKLDRLEGRYIPETISREKDPNGLFIVEFAANNVEGRVKVQEGLAVEYIPQMFNEASVSQNRLLSHWISDPILSPSMLRAKNRLAELEGIVDRSMMPFWALYENYPGWLRNARLRYEAQLIAADPLRASDAEDAAEREQQNLHRATLDLEKRGVIIRFNEPPRRGHLRFWPVVAGAGLIAFVALTTFGNRNIRTPILPTITPVSSPTREGDVPMPIKVVPPPPPPPRPLPPPPEAPYEPVKVEDYNYLGQGSLEGLAEYELARLALKSIKQKEESQKIETRISPNDPLLDPVVSGIREKYPHLYELWMAKFEAAAYQELKKGNLVGKINGDKIIGLVFARDPQALMDELMLTAEDYPPLLSDITRFNQEFGR